MRRWDGTVVPVPDALEAGPLCEHLDPFVDAVRAERDDADGAGRPDGGAELDMSPAFAGLLAAFLFVALIHATQTIISAVAIQRVSWRRPRAVDYRAVEGCMAADGVCKLLSGVAGIMPTQTIAAVSAPAVQLTGESVGVLLPEVLRQQRRQTPRHTSTARRAARRR